MLKFQTQEAGTGKWFDVVQYTPGTEAQRKAADSLVDLFRHQRLYGMVVDTKEE